MLIRDLRQLPLNRTMSEDTDDTEGGADPVPEFDGHSQEEADGENLLSSDPGKGADPEVFDERSTDPEADVVGSGESIVPKRSYCERCEHFEVPPSVGCTHAGTRIVEMVDREHFRVMNCPVVAEREALAEDGCRPVPEK